MVEAAKLKSFGIEMAIGNQKYMEVCHSLSILKERECEDGLAQLLKSCVGSLDRFGCFSVLQVNYSLTNNNSFLFVIVFD